MEFQGSYLQATTVLTKVKKIAIGISVSTEVLAKEMLTWISISCNPMHRRFFKSDGEKNPDTFFSPTCKRILLALGLRIYLVDF